MYEINEKFKEILNQNRHGGCLQWAGNLNLAFIVVREFRNSNISSQEFCNIYSINKTFLLSLNKGLTHKGVIWLELEEKLKKLKEYVPVKKRPVKKYEASRKYDFSRLGKEGDIELALEWGISRQRVSQFRKNLGIEKFKKPRKFDQKIVEYLKNNRNKKISVVEIEKYLDIVSQLTREYIRNLANLNNINVLFKYEKEYKHCYSTYKLKCRCKICNACNAFFMSIKRHGLTVTISDINYYVNEYFGLYESDDSWGHKNFYKFVIEDIEKRNNAETPSI